jgi:hypothetical protein
MRRLGVLILVLGTSCAALHAQQLAPGPATEERPTARSSYDPMAQGKGTGQPKGIVETTLAGVNPQNTDYGIAVADWRKELFENTLRQFYFWSLLALTLMFGASLMANGWFMRERERRLTISADLIAQLYNAYVTSRARAFEVIGKHNRLVEKYNRLDEEAVGLRTKIAAAATKETDDIGSAEITYEVAKREREPLPTPPSEAKESMECVTVVEDQSPSETDQLQAKLAEMELQLQRKAAQLQAKENQITNLRSRLSKAHDAFEGQKRQATNRS